MLCHLDGIYVTYSYVSLFQLDHLKLAKMAARKNSMEENVPPPSATTTKPSIKPSTQTHYVTAVKPAARSALSTQAGSYQSMTAGRKLPQRSMMPSAPPAKETKAEPKTAVPSLPVDKAQQPTVLSNHNQQPAKNLGVAASSSSSTNSLFGGGMMRQG